MNALVTSRTCLFLSLGVNLAQSKILGRVHISLHSCPPSVRRVTKIYPHLAQYVHSQQDSTQILTMWEFTFIYYNVNLM